ncbi:hypothetical protein GPECTOR_56g419 [Gonium pectorale]|uniref:Uncharacterized protein n=1 Tax=Gonium pectorale TaxID=33097 RepID=A0A150G643_GONPE|nr:hypothetical protein GPECTOR_56g419 [Gonium pectorale]|eukprot:KXZ45322.1 hypothetical protein GPECTOR_56g419 [Gonium pectorale]
MAKQLSRVLVTFGTAADGRLGLGFPLASQLYPRIVSSLSGYSVKQVACGGAHTAVVTDDGTLFTFGLNTSGQLGHSKEDKYVAAPIEVGLPDPVAAVAAGGQHTLALTIRGYVGVELTPRRVRALLGTRLAALAAGPFSSGAVDAHGTAHVWGAGCSWQLGTGQARDELTPVRLTSLPGDVESLALGQQHSLFVLRDGRTLVAGSDDHGSLGSGEELLRQRVARQPSQVAGLPPAAAAAVGWRHCAVAGRDGKLFTWGWCGAAGMGGYQDYGGGQLGLGDEADRWAPAQVLRLFTSRHRYYDLRAPHLPPWRVLAVAAGRNHTAAVVEAQLDFRDLAD